MTTLAQPTINKYWTYALWLALFTIFYNLAEGLISVYFGFSDEALTLFGFGVDSFIEVMSGIGILAMVIRIRQNPDTPRSQFERTALRITGTSFYLLVVGLAVTSIYNIFTGHKPTTTLPGLVISLISIAMMWALVSGKRKVGRELNSQPILSDANCTMVCIYMSIVLLASSVIYQITGFGFVDSIGALGLIWFSYSEGKEAFEKSKGFDRFTDGAQEIAKRAAEIIKRYRHNTIETEHILLAIIEQESETVPQILEKLEANPKTLIEELDKVLRTIPEIDALDGSEKIFITPRVKRIIDFAFKEANHQHDEIITSEYIFLAIFNDHNTPATNILESAGLTYDRVYSVIQNLRTQQQSENR